MLALSAGVVRTAWNVLETEPEDGQRINVALIGEDIVNGTQAVLLS